MNIQAIKTRLVLPQQEELHAFISAHLPPLRERTIVAVTSKIVSLCEGRLVPSAQADEQALIEQEAERYYPAEIGRFKVWLTLKHNRLVPNAGVDESNGGGHFLLWPREPQQTANGLRAYLQEHYAIRQVGVIITDSNVTPLRTGVTGIALAHSGFHALRDYRGTNDLFDRPLRMTSANISDGLAAAAVLAMGEGNEQTPLALITDVANVEFQEGDPTHQELSALTIAPEDDLYAPLLLAVKWQ